MEERKGWIYVQVCRAIPVVVIAEVGNTLRVRFPMRKFGLRGRVGPVPKSSVSFTPPHMVGRRRGKKAA